MFVILQILVILKKEGIVLCQNSFSCYVKKEDYFCIAKPYILCSIHSFKHTFLFQENIGTYIVIIYEIYSALEEEAVTAVDRTIRFKIHVNFEHHVTVQILFFLQLSTPTSSCHPRSGKILSLQIRSCVSGNQSEFLFLKSLIERVN